MVLRCLHGLVVGVVTMVVVALGSVPLVAQSGTWDTRFGPPPLNDGSIGAVTVDGTDVYAGGVFSWIDSTRASNIARWDGTAGRWVALDSGVNGEVHDIAIAGTKVYVAGTFTRAGSVPAKGIAEWDRSTGRWSSLGDTAIFVGRPGIVGMYVLLVDGNNLYAGGDMTLAGAQRSFGIARWNITTRSWQHVAGGLDSGGVVSAIARLGDRLYVGGYFTWAGTMDNPVRSIAQLDLVNGTWSGVGEGVNGVVNSLVPYGASLYVGGSFDTTFGRNTNIARWNSNALRWERLDTGIGDPWRVVSSMTRDENRLYVGVRFYMQSPGAASLYTVDLVSGSVAPMVPSPGPSVKAVAVAGQKLYVAGDFTRVGAVTAPMIAVRPLPAGPWSALTSHVFLELGGPARAFAPAEGAGVYVGGTFVTAGFTTVNNVALWTGTAWDSLGGGVNGTVRALALDGANLYVGGDFTTAGGVSAPYIARWNRTSRTWSSIGAALDAPVHAILVVPGGRLYVGGEFTSIGSMSARGVAMWDGDRWSGLGIGEDNGVDGTVRALASFGSDVYVGGSFISAGGDVGITHLGRWSPSTRAWSSPGDGVDNAVTALHVTGGSLIVAGPFTRAGLIMARGVARWTGTAWRAIGGGLAGPRSVFALTTHGQYLAATGGFTTSDTAQVRHLAGFDDERWKQIGGGLDSAGLAVASLGGDLYVGGEFRTAGGIPSRGFAIWHGSAASVGRRDDRTTAGGISLRTRPVPVHGSGAIDVELPRASRVRLALVDMSGAKRAVIHDGWLAAGRHAMPLNVDGLPSGAYVLRLVAGNAVASERVIVR